MKRIVAVAVSVVIGITAALLYHRSTNPLVQVQELFSDYIKYQSTNDPRISDLVDDSAVIRHTRFDGIGEGKKVSITGVRFKELVNLGRGAGKPAPKLVYSEVVYTQEGPGAEGQGNEGLGAEVARFRISGKREAPSGNSFVKLPFYLIVGKDSSGKWKIYEEHTESSLIGQPNVP